jgi:glycosyltransferase involved in cell wall biosynthesis
VIPTWNRAHLVCDAIESALRQREGEVEVIVVDDGSTDTTAEVLARTFGTRVRVVRLPERRGAGAARNAGTALASGELLAFLDSDDLWLPGKLDAELRIFENLPDADALVTDSANLTDDQRKTESRFELNGLLEGCQRKVRWMHECRWLWTNSQNGVATCSITLRRKALERLGTKLFAEDLRSCEDWEFEMRLYHTCRVVVLPEIWSHIRHFDDGSRVGRAAPGKPRSREQEIGLLRDRLTVVNRSQWLTGLEPYLATELERFRQDTTRQLAHVEAALTH